jgi:hypothetical protein
MNELSRYLVEQILLEEPTPIKKTVVIYVGRFQPFHKGHYATYSHLVNKFGKDNVYVGTSNKVEKPKSPFNFKEKKQIMTTMFGVPSNKIYEVKNPYAPTEILKKFDEKTTAFVTVVGQKDASRLGGKYFTKWDGKPTEGYKDKGYVYVAPEGGGGVSGTEVRIGLGSGSEEQKKNFFIDRAYSKFNKTIFSLITNKLQESCIRLSKTQIQDIILERTSIGGDLSAGDFVGVDDGPNTFLPSFKAFNYINAYRAKVLGWEVIQKFLEDDFSGNWVFYPEGPVNSVSFFPAGVIGKTTSANQVDIYVKGAYDAWYAHATRKATLMGWAVVDSQIDKDDYLSTQGSMGDVKLEKEFDKSQLIKTLREVITLPVEIGDTLLMGKFKNKKVIVKTIGKDEHGMPTINGKKVVTFRLMKEGYIVELAGTEIKCEICNHQWELEVKDEHPYLCHSCGWDSQQQEYDFAKLEDWKDENNIDEALTQAQRAARRWNFQKNKKLINIKKQRTAIRKKSHSVLYKRAYKLAYVYVRNEWTERLYAPKKYAELSLPQKQRVAEMVQKKKRKIIKLAKFRFFPALKQREAEKFKQPTEYPGNLSFNSPTNEMSMSQLKGVERYAEKQLSPEDIEFSNHFFDRLNDPRNGKPITDAELTGFFKRLSRHKKQFKDFLEKYRQIVVKDKRYDINIPFVKTANQIIAKTVMRKDDFKTSSPTFAFESGGSCEKPLPNESQDQYRTRCFGYNPLTPPPSGMVQGETIDELAPHGYPDQEWMDNHEKEMKKLRKQLDKQQKETYK